jgi:predicted amidohydrolase
MTPSADLLRTSLVQMSPGSNWAENLRTAETLARRAIATERPDLISLPEMWSCLGGNRAAKFAAAEPLRTQGASPPGPCYQFLQNLARTTGTYVHGGSIGELVGEQIFNTSLLFNNQGEEIARYRKIHLFDVVTPDGTGYRESAIFGAGEQIVTAKIKQLTVGLAICYDLRFPELFAALRRQGAELILLPAAFTLLTGKDHWEVLLRARAIETQCWFAAAACWGPHIDGAGDTRHTYGHSMIVDPWGHVTARASDGQTIATGSIDPAVTARVRADMPVAQHHRLP